ncbi:fused DSP-PTPase phosphatase/NAD kinase-like protein [Pectinatus frisingensis]|uniref:phosphatase domain-containing putative toxin n=1 Tax=Pectinatus frisingensis TaxID=865 RepID=UPI0018C8068B|nr:dual specificity protein phosphatase family protein [Pectinatus frisingensis]
MRKIIYAVISIFIIMLFLAGKNIWTENLIIRLDADNGKQEMPKNFRKFSDLKMSGSAQFSRNELQLLSTELATNKNITIIDLRQESHGFIDGEAVSWYGKRNWANFDKNLPTVLADEKKRLDDLQKKGKVSIAKTIIKGPDGEICESNLAAYPVKQSETEEQISNKMGFAYIRIPVTDHCAPNDETVDKFINFVHDLQADQWLHFHCEAGKGRTTTFMAMYDIMKNAKIDSLSAILKRQADAGGEDLNATKHGWQSIYLNERKNFIKNFYKYCRINNDNYATTWSTWHNSKM